MTVKHGGWYHVPRLALSGDGMIEVQVSTKMLYALTANQGGQNSFRSGPVVFANLSKYQW